MDRKSLRKQMRELRRSVLPEDQARAATSAAKTALNQSAFPLGDSIALYMAADGELDTGFLLQALLDQGKNCYLPVLVEETTTLLFKQFLPDKPLVSNFFGLLEPEPAAPAIDPQDLSCVFMPLVAFDEQGNRLGMGKGYYDRTFAFLKDKSAIGPELIGLAHECQRVESLEAADWDVPLGGIITGQQFYQVR